MERNVTFLTSTKFRRENHMTYMLEVGKREKERGNYIMNVEDVELICGPCKRIRSTALKCIHMMDQYPPWKSEDKMRILQILLADQREILMRESMGVLDDDTNDIFDQASIDRFSTRPNFVPPKERLPAYVYICVDPNSSGLGEKKSRMGVVALTRFEGRTVICGMDSKLTHTTEDSVEFFRQFCLLVRNHPWLSSATTLFCCERNTGWAAGTLNLLVSNWPRVHILRDSEKTDFGIWTNKKTKTKYGESLLQELWREDGLWWMDKFVVCAPMKTATTEDDATSGQAQMSNITPDQRREQIKKSLYNQLQRAERKRVGTTVDDQPIYVGWGAKVPGDSDEEILTLSLACAVMGEAEKGGMGMREFIRQKMAGQANN